MCQILEAFGECVGKSPGPIRSGFVEVYFSDAKNVGQFTDECVTRRSVVDTSSTSMELANIQMLLI